MSEPTREPASDPMITAGDDDLLAALADDFAGRLRRGEHPRIEEYVAKHPSLTERIGKVLGAVAAIEQARPMDVAPAGEAAGATIGGRYKLLERIPEGGFGVVIDFGVAKATGQQLTEKTLFTNFAQIVGTPLSMSPEQAEMTNIDVDTRSDVYSLGVLLYELLTGTTPLDKERLKQAALDEVRSPYPRRRAAAPEHAAEYDRGADEHRGQPRT